VQSRRLLPAIVRNAARNMRRRAFRRLPHDELSDRPEIADAVPGVDELLARAEDQLKLMGCVSQLSDLQQQVVRLRMLEELSGDDVARELGLRADHVATLLYRAKKELLRCVTVARERVGESEGRSPSD
jgi:RNA polymerase sigma-70 factor (ECF subfamily)